MMTVSPSSPPAATVHSNAAVSGTDALFVEVYERLKAMASLVP
jgi:hypothetical protein